MELRVRKRPFRPYNTCFHVKIGFLACAKRNKFEDPAHCGLRALPRFAFTEKTIFGLAFHLKNLPACGAGKNHSMKKYTKPYAEGGIFISVQDFTDILEQVEYNSPLFDKLEMLARTSFPSLLAQIPKEQVVLLWKLEQMHKENQEVTKKDQD